MFKSLAVRRLALVVGMTSILLPAPAQAGPFGLFGCRSKYRTCPPRFCCRPRCAAPVNCAICQPSPCATCQSAAAAPAGDPELCPENVVGYVIGKGGSCISAIYEARVCGTSAYVELVGSCGRVPSVCNAADPNCDPATSFGKYGSGFVKEELLPDYAASWQIGENVQHIGSYGFRFTIPGDQLGERYASAVRCNKKWEAKVGAETETLIEKEQEVTYTSHTPYHVVLQAKSGREYVIRLHKSPVMAETKASQ